MRSILWCFWHLAFAQKDLINISDNFIIYTEKTIQYKYRGRFGSQFILGKTKNYAKPESKETCDKL